MWLVVSDAFQGIIARTLLSSLTHQSKDVGHWERHQHAIHQLDDLIAWSMVILGVGVGPDRVGLTLKEVCPKERDWWLLSQSLKVNWTTHWSLSPSGTQMTILNILEENLRATRNNEIIELRQAQPQEAYAQSTKLFLQMIGTFHISQSLQATCLSMPWQLWQGPQTHSNHRLGQQGRLWSASL